MDINEILTHVDHTLLSQTATWDEIRQICDDGIAYHTASVCIPPSYVKQACGYVNGQIPICTVIGFPNGYMTKESKAFEAKDALENGASEIDMVINIGWLKDGKYDLVSDEIRALKSVCGDKILKVIIETCLLTDAEKVKMCQIVTVAGADYIKTSTGFSSGGATFDDIKLFAEETVKYLEKGMKVSYVTMGDMTVYSSFPDIYKELAKHNVVLKAVTGISSFFAPASLTGNSIVDWKDKAAIIPCPEDYKEIENLLDTFATVIIMKISDNGKVLKTYLDKCEKKPSTAYAVFYAYTERQKIYDLTKEFPDNSEEFFMSVVMIKK